MGEDCSSSTTIPATLTVTTASIQPTARLRAVGAISIQSDQGASALWSSLAPLLAEDGRAPLGGLISGWCGWKRCILNRPFDSSGKTTFMKRRAAFALVQPCSAARRGWPSAARRAHFGLVRV